MERGKKEEVFKEALTRSSFCDLVKILNDSFLVIGPNQSRKDI